MILVDTSVWIDHLRGGEPTLSAILNDGKVLMHPFIVGELACGNLKNRDEILDLLQKLPPAPMATDTETLGFIKRHRLMGRGIGYVDAHLLAATALGAELKLWTRDKRLAAAAVHMGLGADEIKLAGEPSVHEHGPGYAS